MMTLACAAIGPNGERCARAAGHPGQHVPAPKTSVSPIQPPALVAAASGATAAVPPGVTPVEPAAPAKPGKRGQPSKTTTSAVDADADADAEAESDGGSWTVPPEPLVRTDQAILGMLLLALLYGVGSGVITLIARSAAASDAAAAAAHVKGATVSGRGAATSSSFSLEGDYLVRWTATPSTANGCYHAAVLERADDGREVDLLVNEAISGSAAQTGTVPVAGLARTEYRVHASSACAWSFAFEGR